MKQQPISLGQRTYLKEDQGIVDKKVSRHFFALLIIAIIVFVLFYLYIKKKPIPDEDAEEYCVIDSGMETNDYFTSTDSGLGDDLLWGTTQESPMFANEEDSDKEDFVEDCEEDYFTRS